ncbi:MULTISPECIES: precorrin-2 C(20)-methyltransferase [Agrobacterium]|uniref:Precorrin-2 C(20)-methyltransferase n=1 Tax=Agrobacterium salinitolerans TaxID=1183413 RepID=A0ABY3BNV7_9HYPH|nr:MULTISPECIES: precorrin-2 C(20)-methyltransferase [Agrobacterium]MBA4776952.1 precorrin-2 C(20)-methyltransferase [Hyphomicrobiales bacterium]MCZ7857652.1 precorrin-2 C(20)-methyltransferase [Agrobacterium salinitolerans]MCZ7864043.1 precorrin-2 C(20)-methyltransferase [Agrobacterium salinitolerans]MCZ7888250.1 precorrin-2 C(20)-methyltransferase [Agrobacterium salinitolerans]MCZ7891505.1 precorrin-2 C(20)-methyltransferase [Agrobacterium salinitolerans]
MSAALLEHPKGKLVGVGTGPGDPELLTLKAVRAIESADVLAFFCKKGSSGNGRGIVEAFIRPGTLEMPLVYPVTVESDKNGDEYKDAIAGFFDQSAKDIAVHLEAGRNVAVLSEGDPLFYGSYMHLHLRLAPSYPAEVVAGITAMSGCWSMAGLPLVQGDDILSVLPGTLGEDVLTDRLSGTDGAVIMKVGRNLPKIRRALEKAGKLEDALYVERGTMANSHAVRLVDRDASPAPYFSLVLVPGWKTRPLAGEKS